MDEADLVDNLRAEGVVLASIVAELENRIVGHILFSRMSIETSGGSVPAVALAPMAVLPEHQRQGIGGRLILVCRANKESPEGLSMKFQRLALSLVHERGELFKL